MKQNSASSYELNMSCDWMSLLSMIEGFLFVCFLIVWIVISHMDNTPLALKFLQILWSGTVMMIYIRYILESSPIFPKHFTTLHSVYSFFFFFSGWQVNMIFLTLFEVEKN